MCGNSLLETLSDVHRVPCFLSPNTVFFSRAQSCGFAGRSHLQRGREQRVGLQGLPGPGTGQAGDPRPAHTDWHRRMPTRGGPAVQAGVDPRPRPRGPLRTRAGQRNSSAHLLGDAATQEVCVLHPVAPQLSLEGLIASVSLSSSGGLKRLITRTVRVPESCDECQLSIGNIWTE